MSKKSKKANKVEETPIALPPEQPPVEASPVATEEPPQPPPDAEPAMPAVEPAKVQTATPQPDDELPPPPGDIAEQAKKYPPIKTRKPGFGAALKRAGVIFGKDVSTMAKHGLVSSVIILALLIVVFYVSSYAMFMLVTTSMDDGEGGGDGPSFDQNDGSLIASAGNDANVNAGTTLTFDSSGTTHRANIMYVEWRISSFNGQIPDEVALFGPQASYTFYAIGEYTVEMTIVDADFNIAGDNLTVMVSGNGPDTEQPSLDVTANPYDSVTCGLPVTFDASNSTDNVGIVNYTWIFKDIINRVLYGPVVTYAFESAGGHDCVVIARDAAGNFARLQNNFEVMSGSPDNNWPYAEISALPESVNAGDSVQLDASRSNDDQGIVDFVWYVRLNDTMTVLHGQQTSFTSQGFGMYEIVLAAKDQAGNVGVAEAQILSLVTGMDVPSLASWTSTPLGQDIPFNVLTFVYGAALLACVIFVGGLFSKGFAYEIQKGTAKTLFFAPVSVTNMLFAKMLYPLVLSPIFIFPLMLISTLPLHQPMNEVFTITLVSYLMTALVMASAAYGSCLIYVGTKRMSIKPTAMTRMFMYLSLIATLAVFVGLAFLMDQWMATDMWTGMYADAGSQIATFSPFHQGGILISSMLLGTAQSPDWLVFIIPLVLIAGGAAASRKLFPDLFSRE